MALRIIICSPASSKVKEILLVLQQLKLSYYPHIMTVAQTMGYMTPYFYIYSLCVFKKTKSAWGDRRELYWKKRSRWLHPFFFGHFTSQNHPPQTAFSLGDSVSSLYLSPCGRISRTTNFNSSYSYS